MSPSVGTPEGDPVNELDEFDAGNMKPSWRKCSFG
jgi:hypothetical protein